MADISVPNSYWNGELLGTPNLIYDEFVNLDVVKLPYAKRKDETGYALQKRQGYVYDRISSVQGAQKRFTRDVIRENLSTCSDSGYRYYMYQVSQDGTQYRVIDKEEGNQCSVTILDDGSRCECAYERFFDISFVRGDRRAIDAGNNEESVGAAAVTRGNRLYDDDLEFVGANRVQIGDFVMIYNSTTTDGANLIGQVREVVGFGTVNPMDDSSGYNKYLELSPDFSNWNFPANTVVTGIEYQIYSDFGPTYGYITTGGVKVVGVDKNIGDLGYPPSGPSCIVSVQNYNGRINYLNDRGFNFFSGAGFDVMSFSSENVNEFGTDILSTFVYRNFLIGMSHDGGKYAVQQDPGNPASEQFVLPLNTNVGLKSKYSYGLVDNDMLIVTRDNRLYAISLVQDGSGIYVDKKDVSDFVRGHLDNMLPDDEVFIHEWNNNLYVFINTKTFDTNNKKNATKILILDKDYKLWHTHELCDMVISGVKYGYFYGDGFYGYFGTSDIILNKLGFQESRPIKSRISAYIGAQSANNLQDSEGNPYRLNREKSLNWLKLTLGAGIYTDESTIIKIDTYRDGYKFEKIFDKVEGVEWIDNRNTYFRGEEVTPSDCFIQDLEDCDNVIRHCEGAIYNDTDPKTFEDPLICVDDVTIPLKINDYCVCYDTRAYALSPFYNVYLYPGTKPADLYKVTIYSEGFDRISFIGMIAQFVSEDIDKGDEEVNVIGTCCVKEEKHCPVEGCES